MGDTRKKRVKSGATKSHSASAKKKSRGARLVTPTKQKKKKDAEDEREKKQWASAMQAYDEACHYNYDEACSDYDEDLHDECAKKLATNVPKWVEKEPTAKCKRSKKDGINKYCSDSDDDRRDRKPSAKRSSAEKAKKSAAKLSKREGKQLAAKEKRSKNDGHKRSEKDCKISLKAEKKRQKTYQYSSDEEEDARDKKPPAKIVSAEKSKKSATKASKRKSKQPTTKAKCTNKYKSFVDSDEGKDVEESNDESELLDEAMPSSSEDENEEVTSSSEDEEESVGDESYASNNESGSNSEDGDGANSHTKMGFGKHSNETYGDVAQNDPDYVRWAKSVEDSTLNMNMTRFLNLINTEEGKSHALIGRGKEEFTYGQHKGKSFCVVATEDPAYHVRYAGALKRNGKTPTDVLKRYIDYFNEYSPSSAARAVVAARAATIGREVGSEKFTWGKYKGKTFLWIAEHDASYHLRYKDMNDSPNVILDRYIQWFDRWSPTRNQANAHHRDELAFYAGISFPCCSYDYSD